jgi:hypothetical protein
LAYFSTFSAFSALGFGSVYGFFFSAWTGFGISTVTYLTITSGFSGAAINLTYVMQALPILLLYA